MVSEERKIFFLFIFICTFTITKSQVFTLHIGNNEKNIVHDLIEYKGNYFFSYSIEDTAIGYYNHVMVRVNTNGNIIQTIQFDSLRFYSVYSYDDGIYIMGGKLVQNTPNPEYSTSFLKLDENLNILAQYEMHRPNLIYIGHDIIKVNTDTLVYVGWYFDPLNFTVDHDQIVLLNNNLQPYFYDSIPHPPYNYMLNPRFLNLPSSPNLYLTGTNSSNNDRLVISFNKQSFKFNTIDTIDYESGLSGYSTFSTDSTWSGGALYYTMPISDSTFVIAAMIEFCPNFNTCYTDMGFIKADLNFKSLEMKHYPTQSVGVSKSPALFKSMDKNNQNYIYYLGTYNCNTFICQNVPYSRLILLKTDTSGQVYWQRVIGNPSLMYNALIVKATNDGGVLIGASVFDSLLDTKPDIVIMKFDSTGYLLNTEKMTSNTLNKVYCYPNPVKDKLYVENGKKMFDFRITSLTGEILFNGKNYNKIIDVSMLPKGMFLLQIISEEKAHSMKFIKE